MLAPDYEAWPAPVWTINAVRRGSRAIAATRRVAAPILQVGLSGEAVDRYVDERIDARTDVRPESRHHPRPTARWRGKSAAAMLPAQRPYPLLAQIGATITSLRRVNGVTSPVPRRELGAVARPRPLARDKRGRRRRHHGHRKARSRRRHSPGLVSARRRIEAGRCNQGHGGAVEAQKVVGACVTPAEPKGSPEPLVDLVFGNRSDGPAGRDRSIAVVLRTKRLGRASSTPVFERHLRRPRVGVGVAFKTQHHVLRVGDGYNERDVHRSDVCQRTLEIDPVEYAES
jgi:hypothetical protein